MEISCAQTAIEYLSRQGNAGNQRWKLILRRQGKERIREWHRAAARTPANGVQRWSVNRSSNVSRGRSRIVDAITAANDERVSWRIGKPHPRRKIVRIDAVEDALANVWQIRQVVLRNHISRLDESGDGWADRVATAVDLHSRLVKSRIESREGAASLVRWKIQLITQSQIQGKLPRNLPIVLKEKAVIRRPQKACSYPVSVN